MKSSCGQKTLHRNRGLGLWNLQVTVFLGPGVRLLGLGARRVLGLGLMKLLDLEGLVSSSPEVMVCKLLA